MHKDRCKELKSRILSNVAYTYYGKVKLAEACRLFSHSGTPKEIEECLDELVREGIAKKIQSSSSKFYLFEQIASQFGKKWEENLDENKEMIIQLEEENRRLDQEHRVLDRIRKIWLGDWKSTMGDMETYASVANLISAFFDQKSEDLLRKIGVNNRAIRVYNKRIKDIQNRQTISYE